MKFPLERRDTLTDGDLGIPSEDSAYDDGLDGDLQSLLPARDKSMEEPGAPPSDDEELKAVKAPFTPKRLIIVEPVLALYFMCLVPGLTLSQQFIYNHFASANNLSSHAPRLLNASGAGNTACREADVNGSYFRVQEKVQQEAANFQIYMDVSTAMFSFFVVFIYGSFSDQFGRKLPMVLPIVGNLLKYVIYVIIINMEKSIYFLLIGNIVDGVLGGPTTIVTACFSYIADTTDHNKRTLRITINEMVFNLANAMSQVVIGFLINAVGFLYPFYMLLVLQSINLIYVLFFVPDTIGQQRAKPNFRQLLSGIKTCLKIYTQRDQHGLRWALPLCLPVVFFCCLVFTSRIAPTTLYMLNSPLCWSSIQIGLWGALLVVSTNIGNIGLVVLGMKRIGDIGLTILGCISGAAGFIITSFAVKAWIMYISPIVGLASFLPIPMLRAFMSKRTTPMNQGALFASVSAIETLCGLAGTVVFNPIYEATLHFWKGFVFVSMAAVQLVGMLFAMLLWLYMRRARPVPGFLSFMDDDAPTFVH